MLISSCNPEIFETLYKDQVNPLIRSPAPRTGDRSSAVRLAMDENLFVAVRAGDASRVARLLSQGGGGANANARNAIRDTPLVVACHGGHRAVVDALLAAGADPNAAYKFGASPLASRLSLETHASCMRYWQSARVLITPIRGAPRVQAVSRCRSRRPRIPRGIHRGDSGHCRESHFAVSSVDGCRVRVPARVRSHCKRLASRRVQGDPAHENQASAAQERP
jgi:hypothetical protein